MKLKEELMDRIYNMEKLAIDKSIISGSRRGNTKR